MSEEEEFLTARAAVSCTCLGELPWQFTGAGITASDTRARPYYFHLGIAYNLV